MKRFATASFATGLIIGSIFFSVIVSAWTAPTGAPPTLNASAPVNLSATAQSKTGSLGVGGLAVFGNASITGNLTLVNATGNGVDATGPSSGSSFYGVIGRAGSYYGALGRADGFSFVGVGTLWNQGNMTINGAGNGITFPDGTVETTASGGVYSGVLAASQSVIINTPYKSIEIFGTAQCPNGSSTFYLYNLYINVFNASGVWKYAWQMWQNVGVGTLATGVQQCVGSGLTACITANANGTFTIVGDASFCYGLGYLYNVHQ